MKHKINIALICLIIVATYSCKKETIIEDFEYGSLTDIDGNSYKTIEIGEQTWMVENLRTTKYNDGTSISNITENTIWVNLNTPAYSWHDNDLSFKIDGALYNWYAANSNICPIGWHVSTDEDWKELEKQIGMSEDVINLYGNRGTIEGNLLKSKTDWIPPDGYELENGTDEFGLNIQPMSGRSGAGGFFYGYSSISDYWSPIVNDTTIYCYRFFTATMSQIGRYDNKLRATEANYANYGFSIRCVKN